MQYKARIILCILCLWALFSMILTGITAAQDIGFNAATQANQINRLQAEQARFREEQALRKATSAPEGNVATPPNMVTSHSVETCIDIKKISLNGVNLISVAKLQRALAQFEGRCLGLAELHNVLEVLTYLYVEQGYIATRAYLPAQDLSNGTLDVVVIEGRLEDIAVDGQLSKGRQMTTAFGGMIDRPVNLRDIEQGLDQINRLRSTQATIALKAGQEQGGSVLDVTVESAHPWHASLSADNLGGIATGIYQSRLDLGIDNLLGINDEWQLGYQRSMDRSPLFFSNERPNSNTITGSVSIPYGYWTFSLSGSWNDYHSTLRGPLSTIETSGGAKSLSPQITRILHRNQTSKTWATGRLTWKETENFLLGSRLDVASRKLSVVSFELGHSRQIFGGQMSATIGYHKGLDIFGAFDDASAAKDSPKGQFNKITASVGFFRTQDIGWSTMIFSTNISGQWTNDALFGSEQLSLGGYSSVRGVREAILYADKAVLMRNELSFLLPQINNATMVKTFGRFEPYLALDLGHSVADWRGNSLGGDIIGAAIGIRNRGGRVIFDLSWADIISMPDLLNNIEPPAGLVQARFSVSF